MGFAQDLEAVAGADHEPAVGCETRDAFHDRREARDRACAEVVAVAESARQEEALGALQRFFLVPEHRRVLAHHLGNRVQGVAIVERARKADHAPLHSPSTSRPTFILGWGEPDTLGFSSTSKVKSSITGLASSCSHILRAWLRAAAALGASISSVMYLPTLTLATLLKPRLLSELSIVRPCGSRIPLWGVTKTFTTCNGTCRLPLSGSVGRCRSTLHPAQHLVVSLLDSAEVAAETILVEFLARRLVPEAAGVGADFVAEQDLAMMPPEFELEVDQDHAALVEELAQQFVDLQRHRVDRDILCLSRPAEFDGVLGIDQRIVELVGLVIVLNHRTLEVAAFFEPEPLGHRAGDGISHHRFTRDDLQALAEHFAIVQAAYEMRADPAFLEQGEEQLRHAVVHNALVFDRAPLLGVECGRVVLEVLDYEVGVGSRIELLRLALVEHFELLRGRFHDTAPQNGDSFQLSYHQPCHNEPGTSRIHKARIYSHSGAESWGFSFQPRDFDSGRGAKRSTSSVARPT